MTASCVHVAIYWLTVTVAYRNGIVRQHCVHSCHTRLYGSQAEIDRLRTLASRKRLGNATKSSVVYVPSRTASVAYTGCRYRCWITMWT